VRDTDWEKRIEGGVVWRRWESHFGLGREKVVPFAGTLEKVRKEEGCSRKKEERSVLGENYDEGR